MNTEFGSSGSFGSRIRSRCIYHNNHTGRRRNFHSKPTPIHGPVHKSELEMSYSRRLLSWLPQEFSKILIHGMSHKVSYAYIIIDPVINVFNTN